LKNERFEVVASMLLKMLMKPSKQLTVGNSLLAALLQYCDRHNMQLFRAGYTRFHAVPYIQAKCVNF
jgi:hypothetical protein